MYKLHVYTKVYSSVSDGKSNRILLGLYSVISDTYRNIFPEVITEIIVNQS